MARHCKDCGAEAMPRDRACIRCGTPLPSTLGSFLSGFFQKDETPHVALTPKKPAPAPSKPKAKPHHHAPAKAPTGPLAQPPATDAWGLPLSPSPSVGGDWANPLTPPAPRAETGPLVAPAPSGEDAAWGLQGGAYGETAPVADDAALQAKLAEMAQRPPEAPAPDGRNWREFKLDATPQAGGTGPLSPLEEMARMLELKRQGKAPAEYAPGRQPRGQGLEFVAQAIGCLVKGEPAWPGLPAWAAGLASLWWPGLGQFLQGRVKVGAGLWVGSWVAAASSGVVRSMLEGTGLGPYAGWVTLVYAGAVAFEAYRHGVAAKQQAL